MAAAGKPFAETFITAPSPGIVATTMMNAYYKSHEDYLMALAREMRPEYLAIHEAGLILQIDAPDLAMERTMTFQDLSEDEFLGVCELHMAAINKSLEGIPRDRVRLHCCWGNWEGPHVHDIALDPILPILYQAHAGALTIEFANPRHQHEYEALRANPLPKDWLLIPGVIDTTTNFVEHPRGGGAAHRGGGGGGRRPRARDRLHRLRLRHLHGPRMGGAPASSGRSSSRCAKAPTSPPGACGAALRRGRPRSWFRSRS